MTKPAVCVLRAPGTNCDHETAFAFERAGAKAERVHVFRLLEAPDRLDRFQVLCVPGGFSYGDDISAGVIFSRQLRGKLAGAVGRFLAADKLILGICNGFQVLLKAGILPGGVACWPPDERARPRATLTWNDNGRYTAVWVRLICEGPSVFLRGIEEIELPVAHAEGRLALADESVADDWAVAGQIALRYAGGNPNGSAADIAGLSDPGGRVLGLMPHPERFLHATQHPKWTRLGLTGEGAGMKVFRNAVEYFQ